jgi:small subunit ribosomal protein S2
MALARRIYFLRNNLLKIPFSLLLAYHCPYGNSVKLWTSHLMIRHILGVRNEIHVLDLSYTLIQIRKALNLVFNATLCRRTLLIYSQAHKGIKIDNNAIFTFVNAWLPGLLTNYRQLITSMYKNAKNLGRFGAIHLSNPQLEALRVFSHRSKLVPSLIARKSKKVRYGNVPNLSLSLLDSPTWLNECHSLEIPSIQLCDTQSLYDHVTYPIVSNQRSIPFTRLIISLFTETCAYALITEQFYMTKNSLIGPKVRHFNSQISYKSKLDRPLLEVLKKCSKRKKALSKYFSITYFSKLNKKSFRSPFFLWGFSKTWKFRKPIEKMLFKKFRVQIRKKQNESLLKMRSKKNILLLKKKIVKTTKLKRKSVQLNFKQQRIFLRRKGRYLKFNRFITISKLIMDQQLKEFREDDKMSPILRKKKINKKIFHLSMQKSQKKKKLYKQHKKQDKVKKEEKPLDPTSKELLKRRVIKVFYEKKKKQLPFPYSKTILNKDSSMFLRNIPYMLRRTGSPVTRKTFFSRLRFKQSTVILPDKNKLLSAQFSRLQTVRNNQVANTMHRRTMNKRTFLLNKRSFNFTVRDMYPNISGAWKH